MAAIGLGNVVNHLPHSCSISIHKTNKTLQIQNILFNIFSFLSIQNLNSCGLVNHYWNEAYYNMLWYMQNSPNNSAFLYTRTSHFINRLIQEHLSIDASIKKENPELNKYCHAMFVMPTPTVLYENYCFSIVGMTNIQVRQKGRIESVLLIDEDADKQMLTHLAAERGYVFARDKFGNIIQWDYRKKEKIRKFEAIYSIENEKFKQIPIASHFRTGDFCVKNGMIVIQDSGNGSLDLIPYNNPITTTRLTGNESLIIISKIIIEKERITTMNTNSIHTWNLVNHTQEKFYILDNPSFSLRDIEIDNNTLYAVDNNHHIHKVNFITQEKKSFRYPKLEGYSSIDKIVVIRNLIFGRSSSEKIGTLNLIRIFNLDTDQNRLLDLKTINIDLLKIEKAQSSLIKNLISNIPEAKKRSSRCVIS